MFDMKACGERMRDLRRKKNMTQEAMAEALNVSAYHYRRIEVGKEGASIDLLIDVADYFETSLDFLVLGKGLSAEMLKKELTDIAKTIRKMADTL